MVVLHTSYLYGMHDIHILVRLVLLYTRFDAYVRCDVRQKSRLASDTGIPKTPTAGFLPFPSVQVWVGRL